MPDILRGLPAELAAQLAQAGIVKASTTAAAVPTATSAASTNVTNSAGGAVPSAPLASWGMLSFPSTSTINGSHANGLANVPFDGYIAELHRDERVLTAAENRSYSRDNGDQVSTAELVAEARAIREELATLRTEQNAQTSAIITGNHQASDRNADRVTQGALDAAKDAIWTAMSKPKLN